MVRFKYTTLVALEQDPHSHNLADFTPPNEFVLVLGEEVDGIPAELLTRCEAIVEIPMKGAKESFNVSVAAGIALFSLQSQRREASGNKIKHNDAVEDIAEVLAADGLVKLGLPPLAYTGPTGQVASSMVYHKPNPPYLHLVYSYSLSRKINSNVPGSTSSVIKNFVLGIGLLPPMYGCNNGA